MRNNHWDAFNDVITRTDGGSLGGVGLGGDSLQDHESVIWETSADGVIFQLDCQGCGRSKHVVVEWPEIVALKFGVNPRATFGGQSIVTNPIDWIFVIEDNAFAPMLTCTNCTPPTRVSLRVDPSDPETMLKSARRKGIINPQGEQYIQNLCMQARQRGLGIQKVSVKR